MHLKLKLKAFIVPGLLVACLATNLFFVPQPAAAQQSPTGVKIWQQAELKATLSTKKEYRIALDEALANYFFDDQVTIKYNLDWATGDPKPVFGKDLFDKFTDNDAGVDPIIRNIYVGFNYDDISTPNCFPTLPPIDPLKIKVCRDNRKSRLIIDVAVDPIGVFDGNTYHKALPVSNVELAFSFQDYVKSDPKYREWEGKTFPEPEKNPFVKGFIIFPALDLNYSAWKLPFADPTETPFFDHPLSSNVTKFTLKVFKTREDLVKACQAEHAADPEYCNDETHLHESEELSTSTTGSNGQTGANAIANFLASVIGQIIKFIQVTLYYIFSLVVLPLVEILLRIPTYTDSFAAVILPGWELLRNLANVFFILVLLAIGLSTLFRLSGYQYRTLLPRLIFAALLVNFSLILTQSFLAVAETAQFQFLPPSDGGKIIKTLANELMIAPLNQSQLTPDAAKTSLSNGLSQLVFPFFYLSLTFMAFVVLCSLAFFLVVRMIVIWILLMTSPIAIVGWILPSTKKWSNMWFSNLVKYGLFVTILGFFLNVSAFMAQRQGGILKALDPTGINPSLADFLSRIASNIFIMGFMIAGLMVAQSTKVYGASALANYAKKARNLPFDFLKFAGERSLEGAQNVTGVTVDPRIWKKDWDNYLRRRDKDKEDRLKNRREGKSGLGRLVPARFGMGSPEQIFENLLTTDGIMKMVKTPAQAAYRRMAGNRKDASKIKTEEERLEMERQKGEIEWAKRIAKESADKNTLAGQTGQANRYASGLRTEEQKLRDEYDEKMEQANQSPNAIQKAVLISEANAVKDRADELQQLAKEIEVMNAGDVKDMNLVITRSPENQQVLRDLEAELKNSLEKDLKEFDAEAKGLQDEGFADDARRKNFNLDKFDPNRQDDPTYRGFNDDKRTELAELAADYEGRADKLQFTPLIKATKERNAKKREIAEEYNERDLEGGDELASEARRVMRTKGSDTKERLEVLLEKAAASGNMADIMKALSTKPRGSSFEDYVDFMKNDLKVQAGFSDKDILKLVAALDKKHKGGKDFGFAFAVQRIGGDLSFRDSAAQSKKVGESMGKLTASEFLRLPPNALFKTDKNGNKNLTPAAIKRLNTLSPSEYKALDRMSPEQAHNILNAGNFSKVNLKQGQVNNRPVDLAELFREKAAQHQ